MNRAKKILAAIGRSIFPDIAGNIKTAADGSRTIDYGSITAGVLSWLLFVAFLKGWITFDKAIEFLIVLINAGNL